MKRTSILLISSILFCLSLIPNKVLADNNSFVISWWTSDGGGWMYSAGERFTVSGTAGQPDASVTIHRAGAYTLQGGFSPLPKTQIYKIFLPVFRWNS